MTSRLMALAVALLTAGYPAAQDLPHHRLTSLTSSSVDDVEFLVPLLKDVQVVQLGENGHGMAEPLLLKARLVRFLHERLGFNVLAFESSVYLGYQGDVQAGQAPARSTLTGSTIGIWHTEEVLPLFEYMKGTRGGARPLRLAGFDVQPIGAGKKTRPAFFRRLVDVVDAAYAREVEALDAEFIAEYDKGSASRRTFFRAQRDRLAAGYEKLAAFVETNMSALQRAIGREAPVIARQEARSMAAYVRYQAAAEMVEYAEIRDRSMADNVLAIVNDLFPGQKVVVWAHTYHVNHANERIAPREEIFPGVRARSMGGFLKARLGDRLYTIGMSQYQGEAVDNSRAPYVIAPAGPELLEHRLDAAGGPLAFFDLRSGSGGAGPAWAREPIAWRYNGQHAQTIVPAEQFDAVISIRTVSRPRFLN